MLLTRCPSCSTAFRITAELLKQASGQVRCGRCNHVFPAFAHLEEAQAAPDAHGIGSYAAPADDVAPPATGTADELAETSEYETLSPALGASEMPQDADSNPSDVQPVTADELAEIFDSDPARDGQAAGDETRATENKALLATIDPDEPLDLELPPDQWQAFYESEGLLETSEASGPPEIFFGESLASADRASPDQIEDEPPADPDDTSQDDTPDSEAPATPADGWEPTQSPVATAMEDEADDLASPDAALPMPEDREPEPWAIATGTTTFQEKPGNPRKWAIGCGVLAFALLLQMGHHNRNRLATQAVLGPLVRGVYGGLEADLAPDWDVEQYDIDDWIATAGANENGRASLTITATLSNRGPRDQPHPYVRLELKDRWDEPVGSRIFKPAEYLPEPPGAGELMAAGARVPALLAVVDPGDDAYGFELDVCMPSAGNQLRCANQKVF